MFLRKSLAQILCLLALSSPVWADGGHAYDFGRPAPATKATRSVEVVMGDMSFAPKAIDIKAGETVRFVLVNKGRLLHEFNLGGCGDARQAPAGNVADATERHEGHGPREDGRHGSRQNGSRHEA